MTKQEIGQILKSAREAKGLTQKQVAEIIGRRQQIVGHWETGYAQPDANTLFDLCDLYGISVDEAFGKRTQKEELSQEAIDVARAFMKADAITKELVWSVINIEKKRSLGLPESMKQVGTFRGVPMFDAKLDGTAEMKYAARKEQQEIEKEEVTT